MPAFDECVPTANVHCFPSGAHPCPCGLYANYEMARSSMEARRRVHESCINNNCIPGRFLKPDMPECEWQLVKRCLRCLRTLATICADPTFCDVHGLAAEAR